ncbi:MAG: hypothetical protein WA765_03330 [Candidatus Acidiferrum sp.]
MALLYSYVLRQKTRPSEQEATLLVTERLLATPELGIDALAPGEFRIASSSLMMEGDVYKMIDGLIRSEGGGKFLDSPDLYEVRYIRANTGDPPEPTCIAFVLDRKAPPANLLQSVGEKIERARQWEGRCRLGDAMLSYRVALDAHPDHPDLLYGLAMIQKRYWQLLPPAVAAFKKCREARPERIEYAVALAEAYEAVIAHKIPIVGASVTDIQEEVVDLLAAASVLKPDDHSIKERLKSARAACKTRGEEGFFS